MTFYVRGMKKCDVCNGDGYIFNEEWNDFCDQYKFMPSDQIMKKWWNDRGYITPPPEDYPCGECEGTGRIDHYVPLEQALREMNIALLMKKERA